MSTEFMNIKLEFIEESKTNPRKRFDDKTLAELAESIKSKGVLQPVLVRDISNGQVKWELVAGARRFRAAKLAGLTSIPCIVREFTDEEALEAQVIENLQREDVHPLEEALGYKALLDTGHYDVEGIAAKVGKSGSYVYGRLKLADLDEECQEAFNLDLITSSHAILIARLSPKLQGKALRYVIGSQKKGEPLAITQYADRVESVRSLGSWIKRDLMQPMAKACFPLDNAELVPDAGPCSTCPKRTGVNTGLFPDLDTKDDCTDSNCWGAKEKAWVSLRRKQLEESGQAFALIANSYGQRKDDVLCTQQYTAADSVPLTKCTNCDGSGWIGDDETGDDCEPCDGVGSVSDVSTYPLGEAMPELAKGQVYGLLAVHDKWSDGPALGSIQVITLKRVSKSQPAQRDNYAEQRKEKEAKCERENVIRKSIFLEIKEGLQITPLKGNRAFMRLVAMFIAEQIRQGKRLVEEAMGWKVRSNFANLDMGCVNGLDLDDLHTFIALCLAGEEAHTEYYEMDDKLEYLPKMAELVGIDYKKARRKYMPKPEKEEPAKSQTSAKAKKPIMGECRVCGCVESKPCTDEHGGTCAWTDKTQTLCTACVGKDKKR